MALTKRDAQALTYLARRIREDTYGAADWDDAGTFAIIAELTGQSLAASIERVVRHAADPNARTPGAIRRAFTPELARPTPTPPHRHEQCHTCGRHRDTCTADHPHTPPRPAGPEAAKAARARLFGNREEDA